MKRSTLSRMCVAILFCIGLTASLAMADEDEQLSVSVAFGRGLNTAQVGNKVNDAMLPNNIKVNLDGVVHFLVAGFHQPVVYKPGTKPEDIIVPCYRHVYQRRDQPILSGDQSGRGAGGYAGYPS